MPTPVRQMRGRFYRPEIFTDTDFIRAETLLREPGVLRFLYLGVLSHSDRSGRFLWDPQRMRISILPFLQARRFDKLLNCLQDGKWLCRYNGDGQLDSDGQFGHVRTWLKYQKPNARERASDLPPCPCGSDVNAHVGDRKKREARRGDAEEVADLDQENGAEHLGDPACSKCHGRGSNLTDGKTYSCPCVV